uniref:Uncharacterized protein n=1 Tax=Rhipicephalus microplus TaxID=6941 RepID=A0A6M2CLM7_RHIMP
MFCFFFFFFCTSITIYDKYFRQLLQGKWQDSAQIDQVDEITGVMRALVAPSKSTTKIHIAMFTNAFTCVHTHTHTHTHTHAHTHKYSHNNGLTALLCHATYLLYAALRKRTILLK